MTRAPSRRNEAAAGVAAMDPPRVPLREMDDAARGAFDAATARAAAESAARAAAASSRIADGASPLAGRRPEGCAATAAARLQGRVAKKRTTFPLVAGFIARGAVPGETKRGRPRRARVPDEAGFRNGVEPLPETSLSPKRFLEGDEKKVLARAAALVRAAGGFGVTAHELALLASCARGDGGGAAEVAEWIASRDLVGRKRRLDADAKARARREAHASTFFPEGREERAEDAEEDAEEDVPKTLERTRVELGRAFPYAWRASDERRTTSTNDLGMSRGDVALLAAVLDGGGDDDDDALRDAPHTEWLRASSRWVGADARAGRTTYALRPSPNPEPVPHAGTAVRDRKSARRAEASDSARAALLASWPDPSAETAEKRKNYAGRRTTTPAAGGKERAPFRLESRLKTPRGEADRGERRGERRVSWDVPPAQPRAPAATPRTEPRKKSKKKARAPRREGF